MQTAEDQAGWVAAAPAAEVTTRPRAVVVDGVPLVLLRLGSDRPPVAYLDRCPHRLVPLSAAGVVDGRLRCAYQGWSFDDPDVEDAAYVGAWLPPAHTAVPAGAVADNFLDVAHFPFVHIGTFGAGEERMVPPYDVIDEPDGCRSVQEQWFDNPEDPAVVAGVRPLRQRRRATYVYRAPFQLLLRLEELDAGAVKTILFFAQP